MWCVFIEQQCQTGEGFGVCLLYRGVWQCGSLNNTNWCFPWLGPDHAVYLRFSVSEQMSSSDFCTNVGFLRGELILLPRLQKHCFSLIDTTCFLFISLQFARIAVLSLSVVTPVGLERPFRRGHISGIYIMFHKSTKIVVMKYQQ